MAQTIDGIAEELVKALAAHPKVTFKLDKDNEDFFRHVITSGYSIDDPRFAVKLPKYKDYEWVGKFKITVTDDQDTSDLYVPPVSREVDIVRYENKLLLRRVLKNEEARHSFDYSYPAYAAWNNIARGYSSTGVVNRILADRGLAGMLDRLGSEEHPLAGLAKLHIRDNLLQFTNSGFQDISKPYFIITIPLIFVPGATAEDMEKIAAFEDKHTTYEKKIFSVPALGDCLKKVRKETYEDAIRQHITKHPILEAAAQR